MGHRKQQPTPDIFTPLLVIFVAFVLLSAGSWVWRNFIRPDADPIEQPEPQALPAAEGTATPEAPVDPTGSGEASGGGAVQVRGYTRGNGTYVHGYTRHR